MGGEGGGGEEADNIRISGVSLISCRPEVCEH